MAISGADKTKQAVMDAATSNSSVLRRALLPHVHRYVLNYQGVDQSDSLTPCLATDHCCKCCGHMLLTLYFVTLDDRIWLCVSS